MSKKMIIRFPLGKAPVMTMRGYAGEECRTASKATEDALGLVAEDDRELQAEFYVEQTNIEQREQQ